MVPGWLHALAIASLCVAVLCAIGIASDVLRHPQPMGIMSVVWPITALFGSILAVCAYVRWGAPSARKAARPSSGGKPGREQPTPMAIAVAKGSGHCGSACTLADVIGEWATVAAPGILGWFGLGTLFQQEIFAHWVLDYVLAFAIGVAFQYFAIVPMRKLRFLPGVWAAIKADTLSLTAWQLGMYGFMAVAHFWIFARLLGAPLAIASPEFWFMMQIAMLCGFATSYPVNWWLVRSGWKERM